MLFALNALVFTPLEEAFLLKPVLMVLAKCIPHQIEGLMLGLAISIYKFTFDIIMRMVSIWILRHKDITIENYDKLGSTMRRYIII